MTRKCDALILHVDAVADDYLIELSAGAVPVVVINRSIPAIAESCINLDNERGGYIAARVLLDAGHRSIAYISGPRWKRDANERLAGHKRALAEVGVAFDDALCFEGDFQETGGIEGMKHLLGAGMPFTALACGNDNMAAGAVDVARESGLVIPDDLSVIGFDDVILARFVYPKLSTIEYPIVEMGHMAARWVLKNVYELDGSPISNLFEPRLISRASVGSVARR